MFFGGCGKKVKEPVTVTLCHVYGGLRSGRQYKTGNINKNYIQMIQVKSELYLVYSQMNVLVKIVNILTVSIYFL